METTEYSDNLEAMIAFKGLTGITIRLLPFEEVNAIAVKSPGEIVVRLTTFEIDERARETYLVNRGTKLLAYKLGEDGRWLQQGRALVVWDTDFERIAHNHYGPGKTEAEWLAAKAYARQCYRPGSDAQPMDSFRRTTKGYTPAKMARHW